MKQADSLRAEGVAYTDSIAMAEAYKTIEKWQYIYPTDYARACYYYGRLLRNNDDPVAAMQVFINGTHSRSKDYHILGRVYSNIGSICHLANEYQLSYDMYSRSADMFLKNGDSIRYYYALNDMAVELAVQGEGAKTMNILTLVRQYNNKQLHVKTCETEAILSQYIENYEQVVHIIDSIQGLGYNEVLGDVLKARAYSYLNQPDSALYYVRKVIPRTKDPSYLVDIYYISSHDDKTLPKDSILAMTSQRADIQKIWGIEQGCYAQAVQLLEQDLHRRPDMRWLYAVVGIILFVISVSILYFIWRKRKQQHKLIVEVHEKKQEQNILEDSINNLSLLQTEKRKQIIEEVESVCNQFHDTGNIRKDLRWNDYETMCSIVNFRMFGIVDQLRAYSLSEKEIRLCLLVLFQASTEQMVDFLPYARSGLGKLKYTTARKLGTNTPNLRIFLLRMMK